MTSSVDDGFLYIRSRSAKRWECRSLDSQSRPSPSWPPVVTMHTLFLVLAALLAVVASSPTFLIESRDHEVNIEKRASYNDAANLGYATQNGGTKGGAGGEVVTVSTLADFMTAVNEKDATPRVVLVKGTISGNTNVRIGSHKTIIGLSGASMLFTAALEAAHHAQASWNMLTEARSF